jgi:uncharacterized protein (DUF885 family)
VPDLPQVRGLHGLHRGLGLYAERLGKDVGFYQDPYSDYGRLEGDIWRAIRLVVDTGVHSQHWTREQMVQYFHDHSAIDETSIQAEVDRYIAWPSQALAYKIGQLKILELRDRPKRLSATSSTCAPSTTRCSTPAPCRWTCSATASTPGSPACARRRPPP